MSRFISLQNQRVTILISIFFILTGLGYFISKHNGHKITTLTKRNQISSKTTEDLSVVVIKSVSQLSDVQPKDEVHYKALQNLIDDYGITIAYADEKFRGNRVLNRYELAVALYSVLIKQEKKVLDKITLPYATKEQIQTLRNLQKELETDITNLQNKLNILKVNYSRADDFSGLLAYNQILKQASALPVQFNTRVANKDRVSIAQITSVEQLRDVKRSDLFFKALQELVEHYGLTSLIYRDGTFKGNQALTRYDFATILNEALQIKKLLSERQAEISTKPEAELLISSQKKINWEFKILASRFKQLKIQQSPNNSI